MLSDLQELLADGFESFTAGLRLWAVLVPPFSVVSLFLYVVLRPYSCRAGLEHRRPLCDRLAISQMPVCHFKAYKAYVRALMESSSKIRDESFSRQLTEELLSSG